ncbi:MAG: hypothetical protein WD810_06545 [Solirubrobacterales bacterium]
MSATTLTPPPGYELIEHPEIGPMFIWRERTCTLPDGETGYWMTATGGACLEAALATVLRRPIESISLPGLEASHVMTWGEANGYTVNIRQPRQGPRPMGSALGFLGARADRVDRGRAPAGHTVALLDGYLYHDPAQCFLWPSGQPPAPVRPADIEFVMTFTRKGDTPC